MKKLLEPLSSGWMGVITHKLRSFLAILGIVIGVAAVIALMSIGKGTEQTIIANVQGLGSNLLFIQPGSTTTQGVRGGLGSANTLTQEDADGITEQVSNIQSVAPYSTQGLQAVVGGQNYFTRVIGITPEYQYAFNLETTDGDFISDYEFQSGQAVAVLGSQMQQTLFGDSESVGQTMRLGTRQNQINVRIIGVLASKGQSVVGSTDYSVLVPLTLLQRTFAQQRTNRGEHIVNSIVVSITDPSQYGPVTSDIEALLRYRHQLLTNQDNDFSITSQQDIVNTLSQAINSLTLLLGAIAAISLLVGGIGVMNIMLVSVIERTREIGIRKALGAGEGTIQAQFLIEAAFLTLTGGIIGVTAGWGASYIISNFANMATVVSPDIVIMAVSVSVGIGMFFGFYPAWRASRLNPIEALRSAE